MTLQQEDLLGDRHAIIDTVSFTELYERYHAQLFRFVARRVTDSHTAEELTQEAFCRALTSLGRLRDRRRFYPWVRTIAWRLVIDHYQFKARVQPMATVSAGLAAAPDEGLLREAERQEVRIAFARVPQRQRDVLHLREQEELSYDEIAARLGARITTVPPLLHRARLSLRREYLTLLEQERIAAIVPAWLVLVDLVRRLRERAMQIATYFPDAHALSGSVTAVAVSVTGLLGLSDPTFSSPLPASADQLSASPERGAEGGTVEGLTASSPDRFSQHRPQESAGVGTLSSYKPDVSMNRRDAATHSEHDRSMPYYLEFGDHSLGADPTAGRRIAERSLAGDLDWMERE